MTCSTLLSKTDLCLFRTKHCKRLSKHKCCFGPERCQYSHNDYWNRRCPFFLSNQEYLRYLPTLCPNVKITENGVIINNCPRGGDCPFAHSDEEIMYHPLFYKTVRCQDYLNGHCNVYYCPYVHGLAEMRAPEKFKLPFTKGVEVPYIENVTLVDRITDVGKENLIIKGFEKNKNCSDIISEIGTKSLKKYDFEDDTVRLLPRGNFFSNQECKDPFIFKSLSSNKDNSTKSNLIFKNFNNSGYSEIDEFNYPSFPNLNESNNSHKLLTTNQPRNENIWGKGFMKLKDCSFNDTLDSLNLGVCSSPIDNTSWCGFGSFENYDVDNKLNFSSISSSFETIELNDKSSNRRIKSQDSAEDSDSKSTRCSRSEIPKCFISRAPPGLKVDDRLATLTGELIKKLQENRSSFNTSEWKDIDLIASMVNKELIKDEVINSRLC